MVTMPDNQQYTGASFERARPIPAKDGAQENKVSSQTATKRIETGAEFELSMPKISRSTVLPADKSASTASPKCGDKEADLSPAQQFLLARPGEGVISGSNDRRSKSGREL